MIHPRNPHIPTIHANIRYFECGDRWWFGGGVDLTPYYTKQSLVIRFHKQLKSLCLKWDHPYEKYKTQCDEYFFIKHRKEPRGVGGLFFDHLHTSTDLLKSKRQLLDFVIALGREFNVLYQPFIQAGLPQEVTPANREWQLHRRSRYAEFNLVYDRGTKFGLQSSGRIESILMSMPPIAKWLYDPVPPVEGSPEHQLLNYFLEPKDWAELPDEES